VCTTAVRHFTAYQLRYHGDTLRFGQLDGYGNWHFDLSLVGGRVISLDAETVSVYNCGVEDIPDTVRVGGSLELDVTCDLNGLLSHAQSSSWYRINPDRVVVRQR
jgi:hypothetical protein